MAKITMISGRMIWVQSVWAAGILSRKPETPPISGRASVRTSMTREITMMVTNCMKSLATTAAAPPKTDMNVTTTPRPTITTHRSRPKTACMKMPMAYMPMPPKMM